jgi:hypothetical protein
VPWITLLVLGGIAGKLYWDQRSAAEVPPPAPFASTPLVPPAPATSLVVASASPAAAAALTPAPATPPAPRAAAAAPHHAPTKVGPGNVHVLSPKHRKH